MLCQLLTKDFASQLIAVQSLAYGALCSALLVLGDRLPLGEIIEIIRRQGYDATPHTQDLSRLFLLIEGDKTPPYRSDTEVETKYMLTHKRLCCVG